MCRKKGVLKNDINFRKIILFSGIIQHPKFPPKIITPKYKIMIVKEIRLFSYIRSIRKVKSYYFHSYVVAEMPWDVDMKEYSITFLM